MNVKAGRHLWREHPSVRTDGDLTFGERAADTMRNGFGSWAFVGAFAVFLAAWMALNSLVLRRAGWDAYPYILLNLCLSCLAALQGALILIAAKRADRVAAEAALHHYSETASDTQILAKLDQLLEENTRLTRELHQRHERGTD